KDMKECVKCGYSLRPGWSKCPICESPVDAESESDKSEPESRKVSEDHPSEKKEEIPPEESEDEEESQE
ncbi:MAG: hypothetical protein ACFFFB_25470, partial [Candidatus Heimdallarchaeota archaeon]